MKIQTFIDRLEEHLKLDGALNIVKFNPQQTRSFSENEILIGLGYWGKKDEPEMHKGICLNNKGTKDRFGVNYDTVTTFAVNLPEELWAQWTELLDKRDDICDILSKYTLVVEDVSPDSCLGLLFFLALMSGVAKEELPKEWIDYVKRWKRGDVHTTGKPFTSWGALHNALGHGSVDLSTFRQVESLYAKSELDALVEEVNNNITEAWLHCLRFTTALLKKRISPFNVSQIEYLEEYYRATAYLRHEHQEYEQSLINENTSLIQLLVPTRGAKNRKMLVDAYLSEEQLAIDSKKVFLRLDEKNSSLKNGFSFMAIHRPALKGTGNDIVISIDPLINAHLGDLWLELEGLENERWAGKRPNDKPRNIAGYPNGEGFNEPWWDDKGKHTLIAAPKQNGDEPGSKLDWSDVKSLVWKLYNPANSITVWNTKNELCRLEDCEDEEWGRLLCKKNNENLQCKTKERKRLFIAIGQGGKGIKEEKFCNTEKRHNESSHFALASQTIKRYMAACINNAGHDNEVKIDDLPKDGTFEYIPLSGGFAIINGKGAFLMDDWDLERLKVDDLRKQFSCVVSRFDFINATNIKIANIVESMRSYVDNRSNKRELLLLNELTTLKVNIRKCLVETESGEMTYDVGQFRNRLEHLLCINDKIEEIYTKVERIEQTILTCSEIYTNRIINQLTIYGFPLILTATFFGFVFSNLTESITIWGCKLMPKWLGIHWVGIALYIAISAFGVLVLKTVKMRKSKKLLSKK